MWSFESEVWEDLIGYHVLTAQSAASRRNGSWETRITPDLAEFIGRQTSVFLGTASAGGQPYIQHRGGPPGFLKVLDDKTLGFADFAGNRVPGNAA